MQGLRSAHSPVTCSRGNLVQHSTAGKACDWHLTLLYASINSLLIFLLALQVDKETPKDVYDTFLSAYYCANVDSNTAEESAARVDKLKHLNTHLLQDLSNKLQPDDYLRLLQWMLKRCSPTSLTLFLEKPPPVALKPPTWKLLELVEANLAHITLNSICALQRLIDSQPLSGSEFLTALERFGYSARMVQMMIFHPTASTITSAEVLRSLRDACSNRNKILLINLGFLAAVKTLSGADLVPLLAAATAANSTCDLSLRRLIAAQPLTAATASALLMSAVSPGDGTPAPKPCHGPLAQQLSFSEVAAVMSPACEVSHGRDWLVYTICSLPAAQQFLPLDVAAVLHVAIESIYTGTAMPKWRALNLCELPGAKKLGAAQVQGLFAAVEDCAAAMMQRRDHFQAEESLYEVCNILWNLPAAAEVLGDVGKGEYFYKRICLSRGY
jgi:hypothetical protein